MSATRRTASSNRRGTKRKCRVSPRSAAAKTMALRSRTAAVRNNASAFALSSGAEGTTLGVAQLPRVGEAVRRKITGRPLRRDLDRGVGRHQPVGNRDLLDHRNPLRFERIAFQIRHRDPAVDPANPEPVKDIRHQLLEADVLHPGDAFGPAEIGVGAVAARLPLARVVDEELGDLAEPAPLLPVIDDVSDAALLGGGDANSDAVDEIGAAGAN